jgi:hypothetical protein
MKGGDARDHQAQGHIELDCSHRDALDDPTLGMLVTVARNAHRRGQRDPIWTRGLEGGKMVHSVIASPLATAKGLTMVNLEDGRYKCDWCGADLDLLFADHETFEIITEHDGVNVRIIVVGGEEHHRCQRAAESN